MTAKKFLAGIHDSEPVLSAAGWLGVVALVVSVASMPFDSRLVGGVNPWLKSVKFSLSITVYLWTLAWYLRYLRSNRLGLALIRWSAAISMVVVLFCVWMQSARGVLLHYNTDTFFDASVFGVMTLMLVVNSLAVVLTFILFFLDPADLPPAYLWGIRFGLLLFIVAGWEGMLMLLHIGHTVGVPDGGPGLPLLNWSTQAGDLRIAHFAGIHALQLLPFIGYLLSRSRRLTPAAQTIWITAISCAYGLVGIFLYSLAMAGKSL